MFKKKRHARWQSRAPSAADSFAVVFSLALCVDLVYPLLQGPGYACVSDWCWSATPAGPRGSASASLEDCSAADLFAVVASIVLQDDAVSAGFCGVTCASSVRAVSLPTCSLLCVLNGSELCSGWVLPAFALCTCASLVRPAADHGSRAGFRAAAAVLLGFASSVVAHPVLGALFPAFPVHSYCSRASRCLSGYLLL